MGFGGIGATIPWLFGGLMVVAIWVGVWWMVASIGGGPRSGHSTTPALSPTELDRANRQQPTSTAADATATTTVPKPAPSLGDARPESTHR